jgi:enoyl-CoA hydratase/carnithine racemase
MLAYMALLHRPRSQAVDSSQLDASIGITNLKMQIGQEHRLDTETPNEFCELRRLQHNVMQLTIRNAGKATVLGTAVIEGLLQALAQLAQDQDLRALVLTGPGDRTFIAGADLKEMLAFDPAEGERFISKLRDLCEAVRHFPTPVVARIAGWCLGGGLELAAACDLRIASSSAHFAMPEVRVGIPSVIHAALLPRLVGWGRARWMILTGATVDASAALAWGLVDAVAEPAALDAELEKMIQPILDCGPHVIRGQKALLREWEELSLSESIALSIPAFGHAFSTGEPRKYMSQVLEKPGKSIS